MKTWSIGGWARFQSWSLSRSMVNCLMRQVKNNCFIVHRESLCRNFRQFQLFSHGLFDARIIWSMVTTHISFFLPSANIMSWAAVVFPSYSKCFFCCTTAWVTQQQRAPNLPSISSTLVFPSWSLIGHWFLNGLTPQIQHSWMDGVVYRLITKFNSAVCLGSCHENIFRYSSVLSHCTIEPLNNFKVFTKLCIGPLTIVCTGHIRL